MGAHLYVFEARPATKLIKAALVHIAAAALEQALLDKATGDLGDDRHIESDDTFEKQVVSIFGIQGAAAGNIKFTMVTAVC